MQSIIKIQGALKEYAWGGARFLPELLGQHRASGGRFAEYWLGTHQAGEAHTLTQPKLHLSAWLAANKQPPLPFLFKVLDVAQMLSIQVHPNKAQAQAGFAKENALGLAADDPCRNYKDSNDKPEMMLALSEFWLLHGLSTPAAIHARLADKPFLAPLLNCLYNEGLQAAVGLSLAGNASVQAMQAALHTALNASPHTNNKHHWDYWAQQWLRANPNAQDGLLTLYLMNLVHLNAGQAIYQPAGLLHAYLQGQNVELMANSDNVLRAGLTPKHIDANELLAIGNFTASEPAEFVLTAQARAEGNYFLPPFAEFALADITPSVRHSTYNVCPELWLCYSGSARLEGHASEVTLVAGETALVAANTPLAVSGVGASPARIFRAAQQFFS